MSLRRLGFETGMALLGADDEKSLWLPLPRNVVIREARLILPWRATFPRYRVASLLLSLDEVPLGSWRLEDGASEGIFDLAIPPWLLDRPALRLRLELRGWLGDDRCIDDRTARGFIAFAPDGALVLRHDPPMDIAGLLDTLPRDVTLALPVQATEEEFRDALSIAILLERAGHRVSFQDGLALGAMILVLSSPNRLPSLLGSGGLPHGLPPGTVTVHDGRLVVIAGGDAPSLFDPAWRDLARSQRVQVPQARPRSPGTTLGDLGMTPLELLVIEEASASHVFRLSDLPTGTWPTAFDLILSGGTFHTDPRPPMLELRLNGGLVWASPLRDERGPQRYLVPLPAHLIGLANELRLVVRRQHDEIACRTRPRPLIVEWRPESRIRLGEVPQPGLDIATLVAARGRPGLLLADGLLDQPAAALTAALFALRDAWYPRWSAPDEQDVRIHFVTAQPDSPRAMDFRRRQDISRATEIRGGRLELAGGPDLASAEVLPPDVLEIRPATAAVRPERGRPHREAAFAFGAQGIAVRTEPRRDASPEAPADWRDWLFSEGWPVRLGFLLVGLVLGIAAALAWPRRADRTGQP